MQTHPLPDWGVALTMAVDEALCATFAPDNAPLRTTLRPIVLKNAHNGRMDRCLKQGYYDSLTDYIVGVAYHYQTWQPMVHQLANQHDEALWIEVLGRLQRAARRYLRTDNVRLIDSIDLVAQDMAVDTAVAILRCCYPYDCNFSAWAYSTLRVLCRRMLAAHCHGHDLLYHCNHGLEPTDDEAGLYIEVGVCDDKLDDMLLDLQLAMPKLATGTRRDFVRRYYYEGKSYTQLAEDMGKNVGALYKLNSDTLANFRQLLAT